MIEGLTQIGQLLLTGGGYLDLLVQPLPSKKGDGERYVVAMDFDSYTGKVDFKILEEADSKSPYKYLWVGNASSTNLQRRLTTNQLDYLVSQSIPSLIESLPEGSELWRQLNEIFTTFFLDLGEDVTGSQRRYRHVLNIADTGIAEEIDLLEEKANISPDEIKKVVGIVASAVERHIEQTLQIDSDKIALYTVSLNGQLLAQSEDYKAFLADSLQPDFDATSKGNCFICNKEDIVSSNVTKLDFKYYIQDKLSFSSYLRGDFGRNFSFCKSCYMKLSVGENFVQTNLKTQIGALSVYLIPKFLFDIEVSPSQFRKLSEGVLFHFNTARTFESLKGFYDRLKEDYIEYEDEQNSFILNILFYKKHQSEMKILKLIKDVPPARLTTLIEATNKVKDTGDRLLGESDAWKIDLGRIYYLIPVKRSGGDPTAYKELLNLYSAIISGGSMPYSALISQFVELIRIYMFEKFPVYNIRKPNDVTWGMTSAVIQCNLFLLYLKLLDILKGGATMEQTETLKLLNLDEDMENFVREMGYNDAQIALFLLGRLIGEIGWKQVEQRLGAGSVKEPILDKLNYQGMDPKRLLRLTNEVFEKLNQYKVLQYNKGIFSTCKALLDKNIANWPLDDQENVFYILSGYSYRRQRAIADRKSAEIEGDDTDDTEEQ